MGHEVSPFATGGISKCQRERDGAASGAYVVGQDASVIATLVVFNLSLITGFRRCER